MADKEPENTETSPLLPANVVPEPGDAPSGALPNGTKAYGVSNADDEPSDDQERQDPAITQYQGMPEVKARLKYILPAIAIGIFLSAADQTLVVSSYGKIGSELKALNKTSWVSTA